MKNEKKKKEKKKRKEPTANYKLLLRTYYR